MLIVSSQSMSHLNSYYYVTTSVLKVCDTFLKYGLPLMVMPPPGVFYSALLATDPVSVDRLAYIMHRWEYLLHILHSTASSDFFSLISSSFVFSPVFYSTLYSFNIQFTLLIMQY